MLLLHFLINIILLLIRVFISISYHLELLYMIWHMRGIMDLKKKKSLIKKKKLNIDIYVIVFYKKY